MSEIAIVSGRTHYELSERISKLIPGSKLIEREIIDFANGEIFTRINETIRGKDVFVIQTFNSDPNKDLVELLILLQTIWLASAGRITAVLPYIYGSRQDRKTGPRTPITIKLIADILKAAKANRVITMSLHSPHSTAAFDINIDNLSTAKIFVPKLIELHKEKNFVVVSPDAGGLQKARYYASILNSDIAFADKRRFAKNKSEILNFVGDINGRNCLVVDDMIDTAGSIVDVAEKMKSVGALEIYCLATHLILSGNAEERIANSSFVKIFGTDSIHHENLSKKFEISSIDSLLANVIININNDESVMELVEHRT